MAGKSIAAEKAQAAPSTELATAFGGLPAVFTAPQEVMQERFYAPYLTFAHPKRKDEWAKIVAKFGSIDEGELFLVRKEGITKLAKANLGFMCGKQFWSLNNPKGETLSISMEEKPKPWKEYIECVVLVYLEGEMIPANLLMRGPKCPPGKKMSDALLAASKPEWADESEAHKHTLTRPFPFLRFYGEVVVQEARPGKQSGLSYRPCSCTIKPTSTTEWAAQVAFDKDPECKKKLQDAADRYNSRMQDYMKKLNAPVA